MRYLTKAEAAARYGWHREHLMKVVRRDPTFPQPVRWTENGFLYWSEEEILAHQKRLMDARPGNRRSPDEPSRRGKSSSLQNSG